MKRSFISATVLSILLLSTASLRAADSGDAVLAAKLVEAKRVAADFVTPPQNIPANVLKDARAVLIFPNMIRAGFIISGNHGTGVALMRDVSGKWSQPSFFRMTGGGFGLLAGGEVSDVLVVVNSPHALEALLEHRFTMGVDFDATAGTVGGGIKASGNMHAAVVSYARTRGLFAGVSLDGAVVKEDVEANRRYYGQGLTAREILVKNEAPATDEGAALIAELETGLFKN